VRTAGESQRPGCATGIRTAPLGQRNVPALVAERAEQGGVEGNRSLRMTDRDVDVRERAADDL
jgi:hypothetical protein